MVKRSAAESSSDARQEGQPYPKTLSNGQKRTTGGDEGMGEFEDAWEDEIESDEEVIETAGGGNGEEDDAMDVDNVLPAIEESDEPPPAPDVYLPGSHTLEKDEILEADDSVYIMRHSLNVNWPCLSFDILRDELGDGRQRYPATAYMIAGTQADVPSRNEVVVYKLNALHKTQKNHGDSDSESDDEDEDDPDKLDEDATLEYRSIPHEGGVNRVRAQPLPSPSQPYHVATWAETGKVHIWNVRPLIQSLDVPGYTFDKTRAHTPVFTVKSHGTAEGFAMDWAASSATSLRLLTGDIHAKIYLTTSTPTGFNTLPSPFISHTSSIEDLQWSPSEPTVFASCSADQSVQIWDVRSKGRKSVAGIPSAHESDVNVISWNRTTSYLLLSGGDEGGIKVWDLRNVKKTGTTGPNPTPVAHFQWHKAPITSIEWHPTEDSIFAASGADDQITLWDLGVEEDEDEPSSSGMNGISAERTVPAQLLFVHQGQKDIKEVHWHPQIPGAVISTALDGFNIFKTISV